MEKNPIEVGVTGGIGAGKSTVCKIFRLLSAPVYDADLRARQLMTGDSVLIETIKGNFGEEAYFDDGTLNRQFLAREIFSDDAKIHKMNSLVHPRVAEDYLQWKILHASDNYVIREAALLFESGSNEGLDIIITVTAPLQERINRVLLRDEYRTKKQVEDIIKNQWPEEKKLDKSDFVIHNDSRQLLIPQVLKVHDFLLKKALNK